jgi:glutathione S-transferase
VLWCCDELGLPFERIDAGLQYGRNDEAEYLSMNPTGRIPTIVDGDFVLWESNSIIRYLAMQYGQGAALYSADPKQRASRRSLACLDTFYLATGGEARLLGLRANARCPTRHN